MLAPECPYPIAGGGALRTASLLNYLAGKYDVDLILFREPGGADPSKALPEGLVRRVSVIELPSNRRSTAARILRNAVRAVREVPPLVDRFSGFAEQVERAVGGRRYAVGMVEHFWCAPYQQQIARCCARTVLDLHNVESVLHTRCGNVAGNVTAFAHHVFREAAVELERTWLPRYDEVLATSEVDAALVRGIAPSARVKVYPNALPRMPRFPHAEEDAIVFSGNMEYHPNETAVRFFREQVWPIVRERHPQIVWRVIGKNPEAVRDSTSGDARIEVTGPVGDAVAELARAKVAVVPLLSGSGTRLKILEAWAAGLPVVSTTMGAEGLPSEHLLLADTAATFAAAISRLLACSDLRRRLGEGGRLLLEKEFTWETVWRKLEF